MSQELQSNDNLKEITLQDLEFKSLADHPELQWVERVTTLMDSAFRIPLTNIRFGFDAIIGLVPLGGEIITFSVSALMVLSMVRHGASGKLVIFMIFNLLLDVIVGAIPFLGDIFDVSYKANSRNFELLKDHQIEGDYEGSGCGILIAVFLTLATIFGLLVYGVFAGLSWFWGQFF